MSSFRLIPLLPMKKLFLAISFCAAAFAAIAQTSFSQRPKLVVGIVVDQMRWDYLSRYYDQFSETGFRRMIDNGYSCNNCLINYAPTVTAIGHTSAYTGTTPAFHGICGNNFYIDGRKTYCCSDSTVQTVGSKGTKGQMSPRNMLSTTIGDQLRMHTDFRARVIGVSYKDRAAILPAGHSANAAYWLDANNSCFISSTYYMDELPDWVQEVNRTLSENEDVRAAGKDIGLTALCGTITTDMAIAAIEHEFLGQGAETDMLCVSYSQTDVIGHRWGTRGEHTDEAYLALDNDLSRLFDVMDSYIGIENCLVFLTADHGAIHNRDFLRSHNLPAGDWENPGMLNQIEAFLRGKFGTTRPLIASEYDYRFFLDRAAIAAQSLDYQQVKATIVEYVRTLPGVSYVIDYETAATQALPPLLRDRALMGYHPRRSGDILVVCDAGTYTAASWMGTQGTTHGEWNPYDAHIPLLFYGWHVSHGATSREVHITDIAPTICQLLHIQQPSACVGEPITEVTR